MGQSPKNKDGPNAEKHGLANAEKIWVGQCRKNMPWPMQKIIIPKGAARSAAPFGFIVFSAVAKACFLGFGPSLFFWLWPMLVFWALAHAYFSGFGPRLFKAATFKGFPVLWLCPTIQDAYFRQTKYF